MIRRPGAAVQRISQAVEISTGHRHRSVVVGGHQPAQLRQLRQPADPGHERIAGSRKHQPLQHRSHLRPRCTGRHQVRERLLPSGLPAEGVEPEMLAASAPPRGEAAAQHLQRSRHRQGLRSQVIREQHQALPAPLPPLGGVLQRFIPPFAAVEEQGGGIEIKQGRRLAGDCHQGIGEQQAAAGAIKAGELQKATQPQVQRTEGKPVERLRVGQAVLLQNLGAGAGKAQPGIGQLQRKTPLARRHPELCGGKRPGQGRCRQLVLQARGGGQHDRVHGAVLLLQVAQGGTHGGRGRHGAVQQQTVSHLEHGHPDRYGHVPHPDQLLKRPETAGDQLPHQGAPLAIGIQGQQRPPGPGATGGGRHRREQGARRAQHR